MLSREDGSLGRRARRINLTATASLDRLLGTKSLAGSLAEDSFFSQTRVSRRISGDFGMARNTLRRAGSWQELGTEGGKGRL